MRKSYLLPALIVGVVSYGQVGINNTAPKTTLDVTSKTNDGSVSEGFLLPKVTGNQLKAAETAGVYTNDQHATLVFVTAAPDEANRTGQLEGMDAPGFYYFNADVGHWVRMGASNTNTAQVTQLLCSSASHSGYLEAQQLAAGVNTVVPYNGGNESTYAGLSIQSTGVTGLTGDLSSGTLNNGNGVLNFIISGTPSGTGAANFSFTLGGQNCAFSRIVQPAGPIIYPDTVTVLINGQTRQMMTHNLGADTSQDPNVPNQAINGNYYQWGKKFSVANAFTTEGAISGWNTTAAADKAWNSGTEAAPVKTSNDPCPTGFRVPTQTEWQGFVSSSIRQANLGVWSTTATDGSNNFSAAAVFTNNGNTITFPATGYRQNTSGILNYRGFDADYWSSTENGTNVTVFYIIYGTLNPARTINRLQGLPVRCISQ